MYYSQKALEGINTWLAKSWLTKRIASYRIYSSIILNKYMQVTQNRPCDQETVQLTVIFIRVYLLKLIVLNTT